MTMKSTIFLFTILIMSVFTPIAFAEDDKYEDEESEDERDDKQGFFDESEDESESEENESESDDDDVRLGGGFSGSILYITVIAIVATAGYTFFKITRKKK